ncbi:calmodulin-beta [Drosophila tropicalis]|uniref:calmodulin-beta n=1 Tax=Drosophila tropicalis TaxID=46794 RepID=UPI0035AB7856
MEDLRPDEMVWIAEAFKILKKDSEGSVTTRELANIMRSLGCHPTDGELQSMVNEVDYDGNGSIEFEEFSAMILRKLRATNNEDELREAFRIYDRDNNGFIQPGELKYILTALGVKITDDEVEEMIREYDFDHDGQMNFDDFVGMMSTI